MTANTTEYLRFKKLIPESVNLIAVSKTKPEEDIMSIYNMGHKAFGENKVQDLVKKAENLPSDIEWHMIGHLQTNKVKYIAPIVHMIHAVDSQKLLNSINKEAVKNNRTIDCLLQLRIAQEDTKFGLSKEELYAILESTEYANLHNVRIAGLMGMATFTEDLNQVRAEFKKLKTIFEEMKSGFFKDSDSFKELSMGMSDDYQIAIEEGSTIIRIGSLIFGSRNYSKN